MFIKLCILTEHINIIKRAYEIYFMSIGISNNLIHINVTFYFLVFSKELSPFKGLLNRTCTWVWNCLKTSGTGHIYSKKNQLVFTIELNGF